ncbi:dynein light intermediate chain-domain-containing protein [Hyaloraphidium curvatum]|nr:dynein light intermediate chain-domain-containing protein [Hyaloraphidium curvatum]
MATGVAISPGMQPTPIWSEVLQSASTSKAIPTRSLVVLGDSQSGKTTLVNALKGTSDTRLADNADGAEAAGTDLALSYTSFDVRDDEDVAARMSVFRLASSPAYATLLPFALNQDTFQTSVVAITLDWKRPWTWVESLERWLSILERAIAELSGKAPAVVEAGKAQRGYHTGGEPPLSSLTLSKQVEQAIRDYSEPAKQTADGAVSEDGIQDAGKPGGPLPTSSKAGVVIPLPQGCLANSLGIPILVVCSKADATKALEREHDFKEQQFDYIQQMLRTICLKYGASLFYVSSSNPASYQLLRSYILRLSLLLPPQSALSARVAEKYSTSIRPQVVDRNTVLVPAGWDSWGKIGVLNEAFDCQSISSALWEQVKAEYSSKIKEKRGVESALMAKTTIAAEDDQAFLQRHLAEMQRTPAASAGDLRGRPPNVSASNSTQELDDIAAKLARLTANRRVASDAPKDRPAPSNAAESLPAAAAAAASGTAPAGSQNEVIANFFDSLLKRGPAGPRATPSPTNSSSNLGNE